MTQNQFITECSERYIDVSIALENDELVNALQQRDDDEVVRILNEQF